jgi:hypothetical protein
VCILYSDLPLPEWPDEIPDNITFTFTDCIFSESDFTILDLPIFVNGEIIEAPPPLLGMDGKTVMVPFRPIFMPDIGFGNYAYLSVDGSLFFGGGGGGSENSYWEVGSAIVKGIGWLQPLGEPPIIVSGIIYVPLISSFANGAPFANAWLFEDRIDVFNANSYPYGPRVQWSYYSEIPIQPEEVAAMSIVVEGVEIDATPVASMVDGEYQIMLPFEPIAKCFGYHVERRNIEEMLGNKAAEKEAYFMLDSEMEIIMIVYDNDIHIINGEVYVPFYYFLNEHFNAIIYDGRVLITEI